MKANMHARPRKYKSLIGEPHSHILDISKIQPSIFSIIDTNLQLEKNWHTGKKLKTKIRINSSSNELLKTLFFKCKQIYAAQQENRKIVSSITRKALQCQHK